MFFPDPRNSGEFIKNRANGRRPSVENQNTTKRNQQSRNEVNILRKENKIQQVKKEAGMKPGKPVNAGSGPGRPPKLSMEQKIKNETKFQQKSDKIAVQRRPAIGAQDVSIILKVRINCLRSLS